MNPRIRWDPVDMMRWRASLPFWKFGIFVVGTIAGGLVWLPFGLLLDRLVELHNIFQRAANALWRWTDFVPDVVEPGDVPGEMITAVMMGDHGRLCYFCHQETEESLRTHIRCLRLAEAGGAPSLGVSDEELERESGDPPPGGPESPSTG